MGSKDKTQKLFMACGDVFVELINMLVYHGKEILDEKSVIPGPWKAATSVRELLDYPVLEDAEDYLDKNRIHVFDMRFLDKSTRELFEGDVRVVLDYLSDRESMIRRRQKLRNPVKVMKMLHALSEDTRYLEGITFMEEEGGEKSVCDLLDNMVNQGIQQGLQEGVRRSLRTP